MKSIVALVVSLVLAQSAYAGCGGFGPGGCEPSNDPTGPAELCLPGGCSAVEYEMRDGFAIARTTTPGGYPVLGWAGPCGSSCPNIYQQAFEDAQINALRALRAQR